MASEEVHLSLIHATMQRLDGYSPVDDGGGEAAHSLRELLAEHSRAAEGDAHRGAKPLRGTPIA